MRLTLKNTDHYTEERINVFQKITPCHDSSWHYHPQYELLYISESSGIRFVGDSVSQFLPGDLVLVGAYLPHLWRNELSKGVKTIVLKFLRDFIGFGTFDNVEFIGIHNLLEESKFGLSFPKTVSQELHEDLIRIADCSPAEQSILLLQILHKLSNTENRIALSSTDMRQFSDQNSDRLDSVIKYISDNYSSPISLKDVSEVANMTTNSFCRFFKKETNKSFTKFLNEVRIRNAARLLIQDNLPVKGVCFTVGYDSITNFYRQFKQITGTTPKEYRQSL